MGEGLDPEGLERSARVASDRFGAAISRGDAVAASSSYATAASLLAPSADLIEGRDGIAAFWRAGLEAGIQAVDRKPLRIDAHGSVAFEIGRYAIRLQPASGDWVVDHGTYLLIHERGPDNRWAWALEMFTPDGAPQVARGAAAGDGREVSRSD